MNDVTSPDAVPALHLQQLAYLREVGRTRTFTEAARRLGISQPALSQSLAELERRLGATLFERQGRRRALTEAGHEAVRYASAVLGRTAELRAWLAALQSGTRGTLRLGLIDAAALYLLPDAIRAFRAAYPEVALHVTVDTSRALLAGLERFETDLVVVVGPSPAHLEAQPLTSEPLYLYGPLHASPDADPATGEWALYPGGSQTRAAIDAGLSRQGVQPLVTLESGNPQVLRQVVALGLGWAVLPAAIAESGEPPLRRAAAPFDDAPVAVRDIVAVQRPHQRADARAEAFMHLARASVESIESPLSGPGSVRDVGSGR